MILRLRRSTGKGDAPTVIVTLCYLSGSSESFWNRYRAAAPAAKLTIIAIRVRKTTTGLFTERGPPITEHALYHARDTSSNIYYKRRDASKISLIGFAG